jgi:hypothetical protein
LIAPPPPTCIAAVGDEGSFCSLSVHILNEYARNAHMTQRIELRAKPRQTYVYMNSEGRKCLLR